MMQFAQVVINFFFDSNILESKNLENKQYVTFKVDAIIFSTRNFYNSYVFIFIFNDFLILNLEKLLGKM